MIESIKYQVPSLIWSVIILVLCNMPMHNVSKSVRFFEGFDKTVHLGLFFVLTVFLLNGLSKWSGEYQFSITTLIKIIVSTFVFGGLIEILQWKFFNYRSAEWWDLFADMTGVSMAVFSYVLMHKKRDFTFE